jgi:CRP/FNR family transcriptional regulator, nitrogen oxide reductase regulator
MSLAAFSSDAPHQISFIKGLQPQEVNLILTAGKLRRFSARSAMTRQGEPADHLLLLWKGHGRYFFDTKDGKKLNLRPITPGAIFGGAALVPGSATYLLSSEAVQDCVALVWEAGTIRTLARRYHLLLENALLLALDHFTWYTSAYAALSSPSARERLAHVLLTLAPAIGRKVFGGVELDVTNEDLANSANITPFTASRIVSQWKKIGALRKQRGKILVRSPERLLLGIV